MPNVMNERNKAYAEMLMARKELDYFTRICAFALPKHAYSKRKNGKKVRLNNTAIRTGNRKTHQISRNSADSSKFNTLNMMRIKAQIIFNGKEEAFRESLKDFTEKKKGNIKELIGASSN